jgi:hypothetical protein
MSFVLSSTRSLRTLRSQRDPRTRPTTWDGSDDHCGVPVQGVGGGKASCKSAWSVLAPHMSHEITHSRDCAHGAASRSPSEEVGEDLVADGKTARAAGGGDLHLAGTVFRDDAERLEARQLSTELSTDLSDSQRISDDPDRSVSGLET